MIIKELCVQCVWRALRVRMSRPTPFICRYFPIRFGTMNQPFHWSKMRFLTKIGSKWVFWLVSINVWPFSLIESFPDVTIRQITRQVLHDMRHFMSHPQRTCALYAFWGRSQWRVWHETYTFVSHALIFRAVRVTLQTVYLALLIFWTLRCTQQGTRGNHDGNSRCGA